MQVRPLDPSAAEPPFEQLRSQVASRVAAGELPAGTRLPTVRALAEQLGLAAGTVARAYRELEADGVVVTEGRRGTFVAGTGVAEEARRFVLAAQRAGLDREQAHRAVDEAW